MGYSSCRHSRYDFSLSDCRIPSLLDFTGRGYWCTSTRQYVWSRAQCIRASRPFIPASLQRDLTQVALKFFNAAKGYHTTNIFFLYSKEYFVLGSFRVLQRPNNQISKLSIKKLGIMQYKWWSLLTNVNYWFNVGVSGRFPELSNISGWSVCK